MCPKCKRPCHPKCAAYQPQDDDDIVCKSCHEKEEKKSGRKGRAAANPERIQCARREVLFCTAVEQDSASLAANRKKRHASLAREILSHPNECGRRRKVLEENYTAAADVDEANSYLQLKVLAEVLERTPPLGRFPRSVNHPWWKTHNFA